MTLYTTNAQQRNLLMSLWRKPGKSRGKEGSAGREEAVSGMGPWQEMWGGGWRDFFQLSRAAKVKDVILITHNWKWDRQGQSPPGPQDAGDKVPAHVDTQLRGLGCDYEDPSGNRWVEWFWGEQSQSGRIHFSHKQGDARTGGCRTQFSWFQDRWGSHREAPEEAEQPTWCREES